MSIIGVLKEIRTDGGFQFTSQLSSDLCSLLGYHHLVAVAYHPQVNGLVERRDKDPKSPTMGSYTSMYEKIIRDIWSYYLPLVQRILNYTVDRSIGTQPARVILGDLTTSDLAMDILANWSGRNGEDCPVKLREGQATSVRATTEFLKKNQRKLKSCRWSRKASRSDEVRGGPVCLAQVSQQAS